LKIFEKKFKKEKKNSIDENFFFQNVKKKIPGGVKLIFFNVITKRLYAFPANSNWVCGVNSDF